MKARTIWALVLLAAATAASAEDAPLTPFESPAELAVRNRIDRLVTTDLRRHDIEPAHLASDAVFLRRVYLDVIGTLPTADEARHFLLDTDPKKRAKLVDQLLERDEFAEYWAMRWCDVLRVKSEFPINLWPNAVQAYHRWILTCLKENMPYDQFAREMLTASGSNFRTPQVNFYRAAQSQEPTVIADAVALTFMGERTKNWPAERREQMSVFFSRIGYKRTSEWKEEIVYFDPFGARDQQAATEATLPDGATVELAPGDDPRKVYADWLITPENPWFARCAVNRVWYWLMGRGIVHEPDDFRPGNPPSNPELLRYLEREFVRSRYDLKRLYRLVLTSNAYQLSSVPQSDHPDAAAHFACYPLRQLDAEVLADAICQITGSTEEYSSAIPEPFTFIPPTQRSIALADGSITSPFLEMFGRPPRDTGLAAERDERPSAAQRLHFLNSSHVRNKIERSAKLRRLYGSSRNQVEVVANLYLTILSRLPTPAELQTLKDFDKSGNVPRREALVDLTWALVNTPEFQYRH